MLVSLTTHGRTLEKLLGSGTQLPTQYNEDGNDLLEKIINGDESWIHFYELERKLASKFWTKRRKKHRENSRMSGLLGR